MFFKIKRRKRNKIFDACFLCAKKSFEQGRYDIAEIFLKKAIKNNTNDLRAYFFLAEVLEKCGKKKEAIGVYKEIIVRSKWKTKDENFQKASKKIYDLTNPSYYLMD